MYAIGLEMREKKVAKMELYTKSSHEQEVSGIKALLTFEDNAVDGSLRHF